MCTAITYQTNDFYFGRNLDYEFSYGDEITITPRSYPFCFRHTRPLLSHYALIGMAHVSEDYPLYYDAINEKGLGMAGLHFAGNAYYGSVNAGCDNVPSFELILHVLGQCASTQEARALLEKIHLTDTPFNDTLPPSPLHWIIADAHDCITVESTREGLFVYDNPVGVLTNNPPFPSQMFQLNQYMHLTPKDPINLFSAQLPLQHYSRGMGTIGLPGDLSSSSRFVRAVFTKMNAVSDNTEAESVSQFFHILGAVSQQRGCCAVGDNKYEITLYSSCCNTDKGIYYYTTYDNHQISAIDMHKEKLDGTFLIRYPLITNERFYMQNESAVL